MMDIVINAASMTPIYEQIVDRIREPRDYTSVVHLSTTFVERQSVLRLA